MTHICVSKLTVIGSDNGLSPGRHQAIIWTNTGILLIRPLWTNFSEIFIEIHIFAFKKINLKRSSGKWLPFLSRPKCVNSLQRCQPLLILLNYYSFWCRKCPFLLNTVGTPYNRNVGVQKIPDRAIWKPVVAKRNNTNPWSCSEPQILVTCDSRQVHMAGQPASRDRLE